MNAATYRPRPTKVEAIRWTGDNCAEVFAFLGRPHSAHDPGLWAEHGWIEGADGRFGVMEPGDWLVRHDERRYEVLTDDEFRAAFEPVETEAVHRG